MKDVNIDVAIASHSREVSKVGATLGAPYCRPEASTCLPEYEKKIKAAHENDDLDLVLNRNVRKFRVITVTVRNVCTEIGLDGSPMIVVNKGIEGEELHLPINDDLSKAGVVTEDAVRKALKGEDPNIHFVNPQKLTIHINQLNRNELARLQQVQSDIELAIKRLNSAIAENVKKAEEYERIYATINNPTKIEGVGSGANVEIHVHD